MNKSRARAEQFAEEACLDPWAMSLLEMISLAAYFNAPLLHLALEDESAPAALVIAVRGKAECAAVLEAVESVQLHWELQRELSKGGGNV